MSKFDSSQGKNSRRKGQTVLRSFRESVKYHHSLDIRAEDLQIFVCFILSTLSTISIDGYFHSHLIIEGFSFTLQCKV